MKIYFKLLVYHSESGTVLIKVILRKKNISTVLHKLNRNKSEMCLI